jgi:hypothetical protein
VCVCVRLVAWLSWSVGESRLFRGAVRLTCCQYLYHDQTPVVHVSGTRREKGGLDKAEKRQPRTGD